MDTQERNANDIRELNKLIIDLTGDLRANNERTDTAIAEAQEAREDLKDHIRECTEANKSQDVKLWVIIVAAAGILGERFWDYIGAAV